MKSCWTSAIISAQAKTSDTKLFIETLPFHRRHAAARTRKDVETKHQFVTIVV